MRYFLLTVAVSVLMFGTTPAHAHRGDGSPGIRCGFGDINNLVLSGQILATRPSGLERIHRSPSGIFAVHYTTSGPHAVPTADADGNGVPDFVDSAAMYFDISYETEVTEMGYLPPPSDMNMGGTPEYDVYMLDIGTSNGTYGITYPENRVGGGIHGRYTSFIAVDNNFSPDDLYDNVRVFYETGYRALKVTAAHEFHHAVQIGGYGNNTAYCIFYEMSSTWMEFRVFPEVNDYRQYLPRLFHGLAERPFDLAGVCSTGYDYGILGQYFYELYGDGLLRSVWEGILAQNNPYDALADAFTMRSADFADVWCGFLPWLYYTGYRARGDTYFAGADTYPMVTFTPVREYSDPSAIITGTLRPLEFRFVRIVLPGRDGATADTVDVALANTNIAAAAARTRLPSEFDIVASQQSSGIPIPGTQYSLLLDNSDGNICFLPPFVNSGYALHSVGAYPNPCSPTDDGAVYFPVPDNAGPETPVTLTVYNAAMQPVYTETTTFIVDDNNRTRVIPWNCRTAHGERAGDGVYIFVTECNGKTATGKIALIDSR